MGNGNDELDAHENPTVNWRIQIALKMAGQGFLSPIAVSNKYIAEKTDVLHHLAMMEVESSPQQYARTGGALYLVIIIVGLFGEAFVRDRLIVPGDAKGTVANILSHESLWRFHIAAEFLLLICAIALLMILYVLLKPVSRELSLLALLLNVVSIGLEAAVTMYLLVALFPLGDAAYLKAFAPEQLYGMASLSLKSHAYGFGASLIFFGCFCLVIGHLIFRSGFLPRTIGVLVQIAGLCYLTNSFALMLYPVLANRLFLVILIPAFVGEASLCLWLLLKGVDAEKWRQLHEDLARRARASGA